jgi:hypothetical protein
MVKILGLGHKDYRSNTSATTEEGRWRSKLRKEEEGGGAGEKEISGLGFVPCWGKNENNY